MYMLYEVIFNKTKTIKNKLTKDTLVQVNYCLAT